MKKTTIAIIVTLGLGTALFAFGPGEHRGGPFGGQHKSGMFKMLKQLDLTEEQQDQMKVLRKSQKEERKAQFKKFRKNRGAKIMGMKPDISIFMTVNNFDKEAFKEEANKRFEAMRELMDSKREIMIDKRADGMEKVFNILTPEQREKLIQLSKERE